MSGLSPEARSKAMREAFLGLLHADIAAGGLAGDPNESLESRVSRCFDLAEKMADTAKQAAP